MKFKAFLIKYAEIGIKGNNRRFFEDALVRQMKYALKPVGDFSIRKESGDVYKRQDYRLLNEIEFCGFP